MNDLISRQAVIDAIEDDNRNGMWSCFVSDDDAQKFKTVIKELPSVNPQPCNDAISKQAVIDACEQSVNILEAVDRIMDLPSVNPQEPKTGHWEWIKYDSNPEIGNFHCSECNFIPASFNWASKHLNYCPNCGAKMESEDKE